MKSIHNVILLIFLTIPVLGKPITIPAFQLWENYNTGFYSFSKDSKLILKTSGSIELDSLVKTFQSDINNIKGYANTIGNTEDVGDIVLKKLDDFSAINEYSILIDDNIEISSGSFVGLFYGTRTILQLLVQNNSIPHGKITDWPYYKERGIMVDVGRKYYSINWLKDRIRELSYFKLNILHLHFSDNEGFRLESVSHPEVVSDQFYTKNEVRDLIDFAKKYYVQIIPEIDMPGHCKALLRNHPELQIVGNDGIKREQFLDITNDSAYRFVEDIYEEFLPVFPDSFWHIGGDEYLYPENGNDFPQLTSYAKNKYGPDANCDDAVIGFTNYLDSLVTSKGKITRAWGDPVTLTQWSTINLNKGIILELWNAFQHPDSIINWGYEIINSSFRPLYYSLGGYTGPEDILYEEWAPNKYFGGWPNDGIGYPINIKEQKSGLNGAKMAIWSDLPYSETEVEVAAGIYNRIRCISQNCWGSEKYVSNYSDYVNIIENIGEAPGINEIASIADENHYAESSFKVKKVNKKIIIELDDQNSKSACASLKIFSVNGRLILSDTLNLQNSKFIYNDINDVVNSGLYIFIINFNGKCHRGYFNVI